MKKMYLLFIILCFSSHVSCCFSYTSFVFGDSVVDAGNNNYLVTLSKADFPPYGIDFTPSGGRPTGRFTNGFTIVDIVAKALGAESLALPYLAHRITSNTLLDGVNYASGASGILDTTGSFFIGRIPLREQINLFEVSRAEIVAIMGENGTKDLVKNAIFSLTIGSNDILNYLLPNVPSLPQNNISSSTLQDIMLSNLTLQLKRLHGLGGRKFVVVDVGPLGCIPFIRATRLVPSGRCADEVNTLIRGYNKKLRGVIDSLNHEMGADSIFVYANSYDVMSRIIQNPHSYGFENVDDPCCGGNVPPFICYQNKDAKISANLCGDRSKYFFWDAYHPGQEANFIIAQQMLNGDKTICYPFNIRQLHNYKLK